MKKFNLLTNLILMAALFLNIEAVAQNSSAVWAKSVGGTGSETSRTVATDKDGNVYICGTYTISGDFDPGPAFYTMNAVSIFDMFICKLSPNGNLLWARSYGGTMTSGLQGIWAVDFDAAGNVIIGGRFAGTIDFDPGPNVYNLISNGGDDAFIAKLSTDGELIWAKGFGSTGADNVNRLMVDANDNIFSIGSFSGTVDFDPNSGVSNVVSGGLADIFISKLDGDGNFVWAKGISGPGNDNGFSIVVDDAGNSYSFGSFGSTADFDPNAGVFNLTAVGAIDAGILKLDPDGNFVWAKAFGGPFGDFGRSIKLADNGDILVCGTFAGTMDADPDADVYNLTSNGILDVFVNRYTNNGELIWAKSIGGAENDQSNEIAIDSNGNIFVAGFFRGSPDFDPGVGVYNIATNGLNDIFLVLLNSAGEFQWAKSYGSTSNDQCWAIQCDKNNDLLLSGTFDSPVVSIDGKILTNKNSAGTSGDTFVIKICNSSPANDNICDATELAMGIAASFNNNCAGVEPGELTPPASSATSQSGWANEYGIAPVAENSVWFSFIAPQSRAVNIRASFDEIPDNVQLALYSSDNYSCSGNLTLIAANDDESELSYAAFINQAFCLEPGMKYYVQLDGNSGARGIGSILVTEVPNFVDVCHVTGGQVTVSKRISGCALKAHLAHGDAVGPCSGSRVLTTEDYDILSESFVAYPVPAINSLNVSFSADTEEFYTIKLNDISGRTILYKESVTHYGENKQSLDIENLSPGFYFLNLNKGNTELKIKIIKE